MNLNKLLIGINLIAFLMMFEGCGNPSENPATVCKIKTFTWQSQRFVAKYNSTTGLLEALIADTSRIDFYYRRSKLVSAQFVMGPSTTYRYAFRSGPFGLIQIDTYTPAQHIRETIHYLNATTIDQSITEEFDDTVVTETRTHNFSYDDNSAVEINSLSDLHTKFNAKYDREINPFRMLAHAVGNDAFFPIGLLSYFPTQNFNISYGSRLSANNPVDATYELLGTGIDPETETFSQTFDGVLVTSITWTGTIYGDVLVNGYGFEYDCPPGTITER